MPIILRCNDCGDETAAGHPSDQSWSAEPQIGGTEVLCPSCRRKKAIATSINDEDLTRLFNFSKEPIDFVKDGRKLFFFFRKGQRKHNREGCLCAECESDMIDALKKLAGQKTLSASEKPEPAVIITQPITAGCDDYKKPGICETHHVPKCTSPGCQ